MKRILLSIYIWTVFFLTLWILFPVALIIWLITFPWDKRLYMQHQYSCFWAWLYLKINPNWRLSIFGKEKIKRKGVTVMVSNHQSMLDIMVIYQLFSHFKWVSKAENFKIPFIGWNMTLNGYIKINRANRRSSLDMIKDAEKVIKSGSSIVIFPEGTRSKTGDTGRFKSGAFRIALDTGVPIQPLAITGTREATPNGFLFPGKYRMTLTVLDEIPYESFKSMNESEIAEMVRKEIIKSIEKDNNSSSPE
ncbi:MAG TPA: lysophospholipid acyltransferase family protein [Bacteroidales bacterium]|nr:lysophospholipid acyltransferase family protein [Bacteroidales bacterium]